MRPGKTSEFKSQTFVSFNYTTTRANRTEKKTCIHITHAISVMVYNNNNTGINIQENTDNKQPKSSATDKFWENSPKHLRANCYIICVSFFFFVYILQRWSGVNLCMKFDWLLSERTKDHIRNDDDERQKTTTK